MVDLGRGGVEVGGAGVRIFPAWLSGSDGVEPTFIHTELRCVFVFLIANCSPCSELQSLLLSLLLRNLLAQCCAKNYAPFISDGLIKMLKGL